MDPGVPAFPEQSQKQNADHKGGLTHAVMLEMALRVQDQGWKTSLGNGSYDISNTQEFLHYYYFAKFNVINLLFSLSFRWQ